MFGPGSLLADKPMPRPLARAGQLTSPILRDWTLRALCFCSGFRLVAAGAAGLCSLVSLIDAARQILVHVFWIWVEKISTLSEHPPTLCLKRCSCSFKV